MSFIYFACVAVLLIVLVISFVAVVVRRDHRSNAVMAMDAERVIKALYGSEDGRQGEWHDWRSHYRHPQSQHVRMAREHRRAPHRAVRDPHTVRPKDAPSADVPEASAPNPPNPTDPQWPGESRSSPSG